MIRAVAMVTGRIGGRDEVKFQLWLIARPLVALEHFLDQRGAKVAIVFRVNPQHGHIGGAGKVGDGFQKQQASL